MVLNRRHLIHLVLPLILLLLLTACERPLASNDSETAEATAVAESAENEAEAETEAEAEVEAESAVDEAQDDADGEETESDGGETQEAESTDPEAGGGTPETAAEEAAVEEADAEETDADAEEATAEASTTEEADSEVAGETEEAAESEEESEAADSESTEAAGAAAAAASGEETSTEEAAEAEDTSATGEQEAAESSSTLPATHTVAPGENLYRIGLQYGMSWVTLAAYNNLPNANYIRVGQVLQIPGGTSPAPVPPPTNPDEPGYTNYVVQRGDTLNSIGQKFGVSWVEIAEANGIVNPNLIYAGQVLKIPTNQPETPPSLTHTVKPGETLNRIAAQYGVHWLSIAQANNIAPPYVIYPGQVLIIPSG